MAGIDGSSLTVRTLPDCARRIPPAVRPTRLPQSNFPPRYNIAPTDQIPIIRVDPRDGERELVMARWGLVPGWMNQMPKVPHINARAETAHEKALFREAFAKRRALIPATGFFEWQRAVRPAALKREDRERAGWKGRALGGTVLLQGEKWRAEAKAPDALLRLVGIFVLATEARAAAARPVEESQPELRWQGATHRRLESSVSNGRDGCKRNVSQNSMS